ncbi:hypothetical protein CEUSTIGMA_g3811.t1 [Chlamydomonas eustigma]|uniref:Guanylate cyclase domain-containing protein n=1 Tax=Chlamydomonas eustigma TaxID=1157962 RepID=A0A250WZY4_9CHLO|nr:hypothetical protein CEUSTIGMA_g3811.t1 [Chlamydomonas eustigma]|eukprot:GAX76365.1 hypothetical protein CEUSTIGMA_g3811.t1 [Chlamydomonas eustigma]
MDGYTQPCAKALSAISSSSNTSNLSAVIDAILRNATGPCVVAQKVDVEHTLSTGQLVAAIVVPVIGSILLLTLALCIVRSYPWLLNLRHHHNDVTPEQDLTNQSRQASATENFTGDAPGVGADTTLVITDVQNSTTLFEVLPTRVMDKAMIIHDTCMRACMAKYQGYESCTEGDAFIMAFPNPLLALNFCFELQSELMLMEWPSEMLRVPDARMVHVTHAQDKAHSQAGGVGGGQGAAPSYIASKSRSSNLAPVRSTTALKEGKRSGTDNKRLPPRKSLAERMTGFLRQRGPSGEDNSGDLALSAGSGLAAGADSNSNVVAEMNEGDDDEEVHGGNAPGQVQGAEANGKLSLCLTWQQQLAMIWPKTRGLNVGMDGKNQALPIFKGLRVRMGIHCGITDPQDVVVDASSNHTTYSGLPMDITRAVCDCCPGGSIMMTSEVFFRAMHLAPQGGRSRNLRTFPGNGSGDGSVLKASAALQGQEGGGVRNVKKTSPNNNNTGGGTRGTTGQGGFQFTGGKSLAFMDHLRPFIMHASSESQKIAISGSSGGGAASGGPQSIELVLSSSHHQLPFVHQRSQQLEVSSLGGSEGNVMYAGDYKMLKLEGCGGSVVRQSLFIAVPTELTARLPHLPPVRYVEIQALGTLSAPIGTVTVVFASVVGASQLLTEVPEATRQALSIFQNVSSELLLKHNGYAVEIAEGLVLAAFFHPLNAINWALELVQAMPKQEWPPDILSHELGSDVMLTVTPPLGTAVEPTSDAADGLGFLETDMVTTGGITHNVRTATAGLASHNNTIIIPSRSTAQLPLLDEGGGAEEHYEMDGIMKAVISGSKVVSDQEAPEYISSRKMHFKGLRIKAGIDVGATAAAVVPSTGRLHYRGKVLNRSSRVASKSSAGLVLCTAAAWSHAAKHLPPLKDSSPHIHAELLGEFEMKGVAGPMVLMACRLYDAETDQYPAGKPVLGVTTKSNVGRMKSSEGLGLVAGGQESQVPTNPRAPATGEPPTQVPTNPRAPATGEPPTQVPSLPLTALEVDCSSGIPSFSEIQPLSSVDTLLPPVLPPPPNSKLRGYSRQRSAPSLRRGTSSNLPTLYEVVGSKTGSETQATDMMSTSELVVTAEGNGGIAHRAAVPDSGTAGNSQGNTVDQEGTLPSSGNSVDIRYSSDSHYFPSAGHVGLTSRDDGMVSGASSENIVSFSTAAASKRGVSLDSTEERSAEEAAAAAAEGGSGSALPLRTLNQRITGTNRIGGVKKVSRRGSQLWNTHQKSHSTLAPVGSVDISMEAEPGFTEWGVSPSNSNQALYRVADASIPELKEEQDSTMPWLQACPLPLPLPPYLNSSLHTPPLAVQMSEGSATSFRSSNFSVDDPQGGTEAALSALSAHLHYKARLHTAHSVTTYLDNTALHSATRALISSSTSRPSLSTAPPNLLNSGIQYSAPSPWSTAMAAMHQYRSIPLQLLHAGQTDTPTASAQLVPSNPPIGVLTSQRSLPAPLPFYHPSPKVITPQMLSQSRMTSQTLRSSLDATPSAAASSKASHLNTPSYSATAPHLNNTPSYSATAPHLNTPSYSATTAAAVKASPSVSRKSFSATTTSSTAASSATLRPSAASSSSSSAAAVALMSPLYYSSTPIAGPSHGGIPITVSNKAAQKLLSNMAVSSDSINSISSSSRASSPARPLLQRPLQSGYTSHLGQGANNAGGASSDSHHRMMRPQLDSTASHYLGGGSSSSSRARSGGRAGEQPSSNNTASRWRMSDI